MSYPWYDTLSLSEEIQQGDLILDCPFIEPPSDFDYVGDEIQPYEKELIVQTKNSIVLSQSCDLVAGKNLTNVLVCPYLTWTEFVSVLPPQEQSTGSVKGKLDQVRKGHLGGYHLLNKDVAHNIPEYLVVDFRNMFSVNFAFLQDYVKNNLSRQRLLPPYREHLSQAFARFFMRVGLPIDIT